jgi:hypothetical protein
MKMSNTGWGGYAETIMDYPALYDAIEVQGVSKDEDEICEVDNDNPQFFSTYAHLREGGVECIGDFATAADALEYGLGIAGRYSWPLHIFVKGCEETVPNDERAVAQWYTLAGECERREVIGSDNIERGLTKPWGRLTYEAQVAVKARRLAVITTGLRMAADIAKGGR